MMSWSSSEPRPRRPKLESTRYDQADSGLERSAMRSPAFTQDAQVDDDKFVEDSLRKIIGIKGRGEGKETAYKNKMGALVKRFSI